MAKWWQVQFVYKGEDRTETVPGPTKFWAVSYIRAKYWGAWVVRAVQVEDTSTEVAA